MSRRGFTLVEVLVALTILGTGVVAVQQLLGRSVATLAADAELTRSMLLAQTLLSEAALDPPEPGHTTGTRKGLRFERDVQRTAHPALREVRVRVGACELVEVIRVPAA